MSDFEQLQQQFMAYVRAPVALDNMLPVGTSTERMAVYRRLIFNNLDGFLQSGFPVLHQMLSAPQWHGLVRHFLAEHDSQSPLFVDIGGEFVAYLEQQTHLPAWVAALADYEQLELQVDTLPSYPAGPLLVNPEQLFAQPLHIIPALRLGQYDYPVHQISPTHWAPEPQATALLVYRDLYEDVRFMVLSPLAVTLLKGVQATPGAVATDLIEQHLEAICAAYPAGSAIECIQESGRLLWQWAQIGLIRQANQPQSV
ncbi:MAG: putative DNA-binding domain-containing protein [Ferrimonas sp.]